MEDGGKNPQLLPSENPNGGAANMWRIGAVIFLLDQGTKWAVLATLGNHTEKTIIEGFFKIVCWHNTGAAWSILQNQNKLLIGISALALVGMITFRNQFDVGSPRGRWAMALLCGGILGNLVDRIMHGHVIDFIRFYLSTRGQENEVGFPAFNVADSAICIGVVLMFYSTWKAAEGSGKNPSATPQA